jgi:pimeloyl-ACP methyl ester carboxylesterase
VAAIRSRARRRLPRRRRRQVGGSARAGRRLEAAHWHAARIDTASSRLFLPGFGARARSYRRGLPLGWAALQPPSGLVTQGSLDQLGSWLLADMETRSGRVVLAGHSMGAALAVLAAARAPERIESLVLIAPAGLPLVKPIRACVAELFCQLAAGRHDLSDVSRSAAELVAAPRAAIRLARALRRLDLSAEMSRIRSAGIPTTVIACSTDTLVTRDHCRETARLTGARYRELALDGGHVWMFGRWPLLRSELTALA